MRGPGPLANRTTRLPLRQESVIPFCQGSAIKHSAEGQDEALPQASMAALKTIKFGRRLLSKADDKSAKPTSHWQDLLSTSCRSLPADASQLHWFVWFGSFSGKGGTSVHHKQHSRQPLTGNDCRGGRRCIRLQAACRQLGEDCLCCMRSYVHGARR